MRRLALLVLATSTALLPLHPAFAGPAQLPARDAGGDDAGPLATVQALFDAMAAHDAAAARRLIAPGAPLLVVRPDGSVHAGSDEGFLEALGKDAASWEERAWDARVQLDGPMAQVWAPYDFHHAGAFSHCGTNSITLARGESGWQVVAIAYTMRKEDCPVPPPGG